jgi:hypothetical protein
MNLGEVNLGDRFSRSVRWSIAAYSVARPRTMDSEPLLISVFNATGDITAALSALLVEGFALHREHEHPLASQWAAFPRTCCSRSRRLR